MTRFIINNNFNPYGTDLTPDKIISSIEKYEKAQNRIYEADNLNYKELGIRVAKVDTKNVGSSDNLVKALAPLLPLSIINEHGKYPDIIFVNKNDIEGIEAKSTWLRTKWDDGDKDFRRHYKNDYGFGIANPSWTMPNGANLEWSAHYQNECQLLAFAWDFDKDGFMRVIGSWFAKLTTDDWTIPSVRKENSKNTPCVRTNKYCKDKLASNWIVVDSDYYRMLSWSGYIDRTDRRLDWFSQIA